MQLWRQACVTPSFREGVRQRRLDANGGADSAGAEGRLQHQHLPCDGFGFLGAPELCQSR
jgi:hypothetical protein